MNAAIHNDIYDIETKAKGGRTVVPNVGRSPKALRAVVKRRREQERVHFTPDDESRAKDAVLTAAADRSRNAANNFDPLNYISKTKKEEEKGFSMERNRGKDMSALANSLDEEVVMLSVGVKLDPVPQRPARVGKMSILGVMASAERHALQSKAEKLEKAQQKVQMQLAEVELKKAEKIRREQIMLGKPVSAELEATIKTLEKKAKGIVDDDKDAGKGTRSVELEGKGKGQEKTAEEGDGGNGKEDLSWVKKQASRMKKKPVFEEEEYALEPPTLGMSDRLRKMLRGDE